MLRGLASLYWFIVDRSLAQPLVLLLTLVSLVYIDKIAVLVWYAIFYIRTPRDKMVDFYQWIARGSAFYYNYATDEIGVNRQSLIYGAFLACLLFFCLNILRYSCQRTTKLLNDEIRNARLEAVAERMVPGSTFEEKATMPKFQVEVWVRANGDSQFYYRGAGFRIGDKCHTASHVLMDAAVIRIKPCVGDAYVDLKPEHFVDTACDVTWATLTDRAWTKLAVSQAKLACGVSHGIWLKVSALAKSSFGLLTDYVAMGMVEYSGSTLKGFSGAPYHMNKIVYGMHVGSDPKNVGFSASYISMLHRAHNKPVLAPEDSADYLMGQMERHQEDEFIYERSPVNPDEYRIRVAGQYHIVDSEVFGQLTRTRRARGMTQRSYECEDARTEAHFLGQRHPQEVEELPLPPADLNQMPRPQQLPPMSIPQFPESALPPQARNPPVTSQLTADAFESQLVGRLVDQVVAQVQSALRQPTVESASRSRTSNSDTTGPRRTPAQPRNPSATTSANSNRQNRVSHSERLRIRAQVAERELLSLRQRMLTQEQQSRREPSSENTGLPPSYDASILGGSILPESNR